MLTIMFFIMIFWYFLGCVLCMLAGIKPNDVDLVSWMKILVIGGPFMMFHGFMNHLFRDTEMKPIAKGLGRWLMKK